MKAKVGQILLGIFRYVTPLLGEASRYLGRSCLDLVSGARLVFLWRARRRSPERAGKYEGQIDALRQQRAARWAQRQTLSGRRRWRQGFSNGRCRFERLADTEWDGVSVELTSVTRGDGDMITIKFKYTNSGSKAADISRLGQFSHDNVATHVYYVRPVVPNTRPDGSDDPEGRQKNRRVEITVKK